VKGSFGHLPRLHRDGEPEGVQVQLAGRIAGDAPAQAIALGGPDDALPGRQHAGR
jgi:hypothetical protein